MPVDKLLTVFERALVDITNKVGVDINRAITDSYYQHLLPFVAGLGRRKAQALVKKIGALVRVISVGVDHNDLCSIPGWNSDQS